MQRRRENYKNQELMVSLLFVKKILLTYKSKLAIWLRNFWRKASASSNLLKIWLKLKEIWNKLKKDMRIDLKKSKRNVMIESNRSKKR